MERKNKNRCLRIGDLRMEDQGVQSAQAILVKIFSFFQLRLKRDNQCTFKLILNTDRRFKAAVWT